jgi:phosphonoacetate hydrolase
MSKGQTVTVNRREYKWPRCPLVVICCDGNEPQYMEEALAKGLMPNLEVVLKDGLMTHSLSVLPSFTNPNNLSIVTGRPPLIHGISGNYFLDPESGEEVLMNDPKYLRAPTILEAFQKQGARIVVVTAKDKLRRLLSHGLVFDGSAIAFSAEMAAQADLDGHGISNVCEVIGMPVPEVYSAELSEFVFAAGAELLTSFRPDLMYLSTSDYVQHKYAPGEPEADDFYAMMDRHLGALHRAGAVVVITADHGMKAKTDALGRPDVLYLQDLLDRWLGTGEAKVILPITDPYVAHHSALGSFATVYLRSAGIVENIKLRIADLHGIQKVFNRKDGCAELELPAERMGDLIVLAHGTKVLGTRESDHDLSRLEAPLRSHGGMSEQEVPMIINRKIENLPRTLRNFDAFALGLNLTLE